MNLLPEARKKSLVHLYLVRVAVVGTLLFSGVLVIHAALTVPTLLYAKGLVAERTAELESLKTRLAGSEDRRVGERISKLNTRAESLIKTAQAPSASGAIRAITGIPHSGVRISSISFVRGAGSEENRMILRGVATTRDALRTYVATLSALSYITTADLPISAYAKEADIGFTLTLTGTLLP